MEQHPGVIRRHALFKRQYRRVIAAVTDFHSLLPEAQWELLRAQVVAETVTRESTLLDALDRRASRRDEVLAGLENGWKQDLATHARPRG